jgi:NitT/TauT family transport system ATP-binding protein
LHQIRDVIAAEIQVRLAHPRNRLDEEFHNLVDELYSILTSRAAESLKTQSQIHGGLVQVPPPVGPHLISAVIEAVAQPPSEGQADLADIARLPDLRAKDLFAVAEALHILEFAELRDGAIRLTAAGRVFAQSEAEERKRLFKEHLLRFVPFAAHIRHVLDEREGHSAPRVRFKSELEDHLSAGDAEKTLRTVIGWGRYAEVFSYDDVRRMFSSDHSAG